MKKFQNIGDKWLLFVLIILWQGAVSLGWVAPYILPSPLAIVKELFASFQILLYHTAITFMEGMAGLMAATLIAFFTALAMDRYPGVKKALYPLLVISQTVPIIIIAPLIAMWFGFGIAPKIFVVILVCFFPITISLADGLSEVDSELIDLLRSMGATPFDIYTKIKLPYTLSNFFSGLKIAATYSIMGAVIGEWLGGKAGLGVYMLRARNSFALEKVFASILIIVLLSIGIFGLIKLGQKKAMPWAQLQEDEIK
ncbi:MAG: ABC transporter permease [delta proteobacterium ML8_F1]|nr:MAG: ABC transporter permease [delta proteobacterium ML8_F1]